MRIRSSLLLTALVLASCGGSSSDTACTTVYWDGTIGTCVPENWHVVEQEVLAERGVPEEVIVAFQSDEPVAGQFATVTVTREPLSEEISSPDYSDASIQSVQLLPGYEQIDEEEVEVGEENVTLHIFSAQPRQDQPQVRFYQLSAVSEQTGYTFTAAMPLTVEESLEEDILTVMRNASFTDPNEVAEEE